MEYKLPEDQIPLFKHHFQKGNQFSEGLIILLGSGPQKLGFWKMRKAQKAVKHYQACLALLPNHWQAHWLLAKVYQAMLKHQKALNHFAQASEIELSNPDVPREASIAAMDAGKIELAVEYSLEALNRAPDDPGLTCNHAINLMMNGQDEAALLFIKKAIDLDPQDEINQNAFALIEAVKNGTRPRPSIEELG